MALYEKTKGPFYFTAQPCTIRVHPPKVVGIHQMHLPWRQGWALTIPYWPFRVAIVGLWWETPPIEGELDDERWLAPRWLPNTVEEIAEWDDGGSEEEAEARI